MKTNLAAVILALILGFVSGWFIKPMPIPDKIEVIQDKNNPPPEQIKDIPAKITYETDPAGIEKARTFGIQQAALNRFPKFADMDTTFPDGERLQVRYHFPPVNKFDLIRDPAAPNLIVKTEYVPMKLKFYQTQKAGFVMGAATTAAIVFLVK